MLQKHQPVIAALALSLTWAVATISATTIQPGQFPPARLVNLEVLPKDTTPAAAINVMKAMTQALGVRCDHCHVGVDGQPLTSFDFVSDQKPAKTTARAMLRMVADINASLDKAVPSTTAGRVTCMTCHNGARTPKR